ncbi:MAG: hypothetical protein ABIS86_14180 [Streptosporangiaceae bacterium]
MTAIETYCAHCGETGQGHVTCEAALRMEPPRYCGRCRRRMVVQVTPRGWSARCSEHGVLAPS